MSSPRPTKDEILEQARQLSGEARAAYLKSVAGNDEKLQRQIEDLIQACEQAGDFLAQPAAEALGTFILTTNMFSDIVAVTEKPGDKIGRYKLREKIGEGGCGIVYVADQEEPVRRRVALKVIKLGMDTKQVVARFEAERQVLALMDHPNIAKVLDAGATETGRPYFVMELVRGIKITDYCDQNNLSTAERLKLFIQICKAVQHAHQKGIIHRDIKPSNILVTLHDGVPVPKVIDFGIAKATTDQRLTDKTIYTAFEQFIGTPAYMSPEQAEMSGLDIDTRSDIYSLGVLLYELLTGGPPFDPEVLTKVGIDEIRRRIRNDEPPKPSTRLGTLANLDLTTVASRRHVEPLKLIRVIRGDLDWIVMKALEKDRTRRYETVNGLSLDIQRHLGNEPVVARPPSNIYRLRKIVRRNKGTVAAATAIFVSLVIGISVSVWETVRATKAEHAALTALDELHRTAPALAEQARSLVSQERYDEAIEKLNYASKFRPEAVDYVLKKGDLLECQFRFADAAEAYRKALLITPDSAQAKLNLALCERILAASGDKTKPSRENLSDLMAMMEQEQRPIGEQLPIARLLDTDTKVIQNACFALLRGVEVSRGKPLAQRLSFRHDGTIDLDLSDTSIADLTPLRELPLDALELNQTRVQSLQPIRGYPLGRALREINVSGTPITDVTPLKESPNLELLGVAGNNISNLEPLRGMHLKQLYIAYTLVSDLSPLRGMPLETIFMEHCLRITDVGPLTNMDTLKNLTLPNRTIRNIETLRHLPELKRVGFEFNPNVGPDKTTAQFWEDWDKNHVSLKEWFTRLDKLPNPPGISLKDHFRLSDDGESELDLSGTAFSDIGQLRDLPLTQLKVLNTKLKTLEPIRHSLLAHSLRTIGLDHTDISDISPLKDCTNLELVAFGNTHVSDLSALRGLPIKQLYLWGTAVTNIAPVQDLPLVTINMGGAPIKDVQPLAKIKSLIWIQLPEEATNIDCLRELPLLRIGFNWVKDVGPGKSANQFWADWDKQKLPVQNATNHSAPAKP